MYPRDAVHFSRELTFAGECKDLNEKRIRKGSQTRLINLRLTHRPTKKLTFLVKCQECGMLSYLAILECITLTIGIFGTKSTYCGV